MGASSDSLVISTLDTKLVQVCPKSGETLRRISLVRTEDARFLRTEKEQVELVSVA